MLGINQPAQPWDFHTFCRQKSSDHSAGSTIGRPLSGVNNRATTQRGVTIQVWRFSRTKISNLALETLVDEHVRALQISVHRPWPEHSATFPSQLQAERRRHLVLPLETLRVASVNTALVQECAALRYLMKHPAAHRPAEAGPHRQVIEHSPQVVFACKIPPQKTPSQNRPWRAIAEHRGISTPPFGPKRAKTIRSDSAKQILMTIP
jgi:hypothetical protein